jgi:hypothetical protein
VNVDKTWPPYGNTRRLITGADVKNDAKRAHSSVVPGGSAVKNANGKFIHEDVWRYLFTHPVEEFGEPVQHDSKCAIDLIVSSSSWRSDGSPQLLCHASQRAIHFFTVGVNRVRL